MKNIVKITNPGLFNSDTLYYANELGCGVIEVTARNKETGEKENVILNPAQYEVIDPREI